MEFELPTELGERLAFGAACFTMVVGFFIMFAPAIAMRAFALAPRGDRPEGYAEMRSTIGGFYLGCGLAAVLLAQPMVYLAFGASFAMALFARVISILSDSGATWRNFLLLVVQALLAALPLGYAFGLI